MRQRGKSGERGSPGEAKPTASPTASGLASVLARNIRLMEKRRAHEEASATPEERAAAAITGLIGNMRFVYLHILLYGFWILSNIGLLSGVPKFDSGFGILAMAASVEAIFLSTFILITQNRMSAAADKRAELNLQIDLLAEHEVTRLVTLLSAIADHLGIETEVDAEVDELKQDTAPEEVLNEIEERRQ